jgi:beta-mannosidase
VPGDLEEYIAYSMLTQAEGLKYGIEHYRRNKPKTSGALFWQLNDCWPGTSWSVIDYYLLPKASYHYAKKFYHPILLTIDHDPGADLKVWIVNDRLEGYEDEIELAVYDFYGEKAFSKKWNVSVEANSAYKLDAVPEEKALGGLRPEEAVIVLSSLNDKTYENTYYFRDQKDVVLPGAEVTVEFSKEDHEITLSSDALARMVTIEIDIEQLVLEDNFFDLQPNVTKTLKVSQAEGKDIPWETLRVKAINSVKTKKTEV